jgi:flagellar motor switch protein FliG
MIQKQYKPTLAPCLTIPAQTITTMSSGSDQRIRHVAIVLQSLDAATSRGLLGQLPPAQSKLVRQAMVNLGTVSPQERAAAFDAMQGLLKSAGIRTTTSQRGESPNEETTSPAAALLAAQAAQGTDQIEWSSQALQSQTHAPPSTAPFPVDRTFPVDRASSLHNMPTEVLADILQSERPLVIATVINQVSVERATAIVQALPLAVAGATLAALPHLHLTDPAILRDIQLELERKIGQHEPPLQATAEGLAKLQAILAGMPASQYDIWTNAVAQSNPILASKLGWRAATPIPPMPTSRTSEFGTSAATSSPVPTIAFPLVAKTTDALSAANPTSSSVNANIASASQDKKDKFDEPKILPFPVSNDVATTATTEVRPLERMSNLTDRDFVAVLHACQPQIVLLALRGASREFVTRVERLLPPKDVKRLRIKLNSMGPMNLREVDAAQQQIASTAESMLAVGKIGALENVSFTAAA